MARPPDILQRSMRRLNVCVTVDVCLCGGYNTERKKNAKLELNRAKRQQGLQTEAWILEAI